jgi:hypothetical protein
MKQPYLLAFALAGACACSAADLVVFDFNTVADPNNAQSTVIPADFTAANLAVPGITGAGGLETYLVRNPATAYDSDVLLTARDNNGSDTALSFANDGFFSFTVTPDSGFELDLSSLSFLIAKGGASETRNYEVRSSLTGATSLAGPAMPAAVRGDGTAGMDNVSIDLTGFSELQNVTTAVTFQFITATTGNFNASLEWDDITLGGDVSVVPEPSTYAALLGLGALGLVMWRRRRAA